MSDTTSTCPEAILAAIPWYPDALSREECGAVEAHAADCESCRAELAFLRGDEEPAVDVPDAAAVYARVLERIAGPDDSAPDGSGGVARVHRFSERLRGSVSIAAGLGVALLSGMLTTGVIWTVRVAPAYETASVALPDVRAGGEHLEVVFGPEATAGEMAAQLRDVGATVVSGPTPRGVYRLRLAPGIDAGEALEKLRGAERGVVTYAEASRR